jgi:signal peptidase II
MFVWGLVIATTVFAVDQASKEWASVYLREESILIWPNFFDLTLVHNLGAAFGMFRTLPEVWRLGLLAGVAVVASGALLWLLRQSVQWRETIGYALLLGGALGNLTDRIRWGWVVDFLHVHWYDLSWPVFNVADSAITVGITLLLWEHFFRQSEAVPA